MLAMTDLARLKLYLGEGRLCGHVSSPLSNLQFLHSAESSVIAD